MKLVQSSLIVSQFLPPRDISICYNLSIMTQVNEIDQERHIHLCFEEFIEALARIADKMSDEEIDHLYVSC